MDRPIHISNMITYSIGSQHIINKYRIIITLGSLNVIEITDHYFSYFNTCYVRVVAMNAGQATHGRKNHGA